ncbi:MAG: hypothetical protein WD638_08755 [Nitriliruptoraceae bacterium]
MRCPNCLDEYEAGVDRCVTCRVALVSEDELPDGDASDRLRQPTLPRTPNEVPLGTFHPAMARVVEALLDERGIGHDRRERDEGVQLRVDRRWQDDVRAELLLRWDELLADLEVDEAEEVLPSGGQAPGWLDPPVGGHIDRDGRLVVEGPAEDDPDSSRTLGPAMIVGGVVLAVSAWQVVEVPALILLGVALAIVGLLLPR